MADMIDKAEALAPCPFCGGEARKWQDPSHSAAWFIGCDDGDRDCFGSIHWAETEAEAIAAWNRRAALPARGVGVKAGLTRREMEVLRAIVHDHYGSEIETNSHAGAEMAKGILGKIKRTLALAPTDAAQAREAALAAIKAGFLSAAPGEWRVSDIERVTDAILRAMEMLEQNGQLHWWQKKALLEILNAPPPPPPPVFNFGCSVCGAKGIMGYVCPRPDCPSLARATS